MWNKGYNDRLRLLNTHSLEYRHLYSDQVLCFQLLNMLCGGFERVLAFDIQGSVSNYNVSQKIPPVVF